MIEPCKRRLVHSLEKFGAGERAQGVLGLNHPSDCLPRVRRCAWSRSRECLRRGIGLPPPDYVHFVIRMDMPI